MKHIYPNSILPPIQPVVVTLPRKPLFEERAEATLERAGEIFRHRGTQYSDTWRDCQFIKMKAVARELGCLISDEQFRALATAAFCDMKYWRQSGKYSDDSIIDGINYDAFLAEEMRVLKTNSALD